VGRAFAEAGNDELFRSDSDSERAGATDRITGSERERIARASAYGTTAVRACARCRSRWPQGMVDERRHVLGAGVAAAKRVIVVSTIDLTCTIDVDCANDFKRTVDIDRTISGPASNVESGTEAHSEHSTGGDAKSRRRARTV
jgi:hypothetical protein